MLIVLQTVIAGLYLFVLYGAGHGGYGKALPGWVRGGCDCRGVL